MILTKNTALLLIKKVLFQILVIHVHKYIRYTQKLILQKNYNSFSIVPKSESVISNLFVSHAF
jgi:hypothetical protein